MPPKISAPATSRITSAKIFTPAKAELSISLKPLTNLVRFSLNFGRSFVRPVAKPLIILPKNSPRPVPIFAKIATPLSKNSSAPGISPINPATAVRTAPTAAIIRIIFAAAWAESPTAPILLAISAAVDKAIITVDKAIAVSNEVLSSNLLSNPKTTPTASIIAAMIAIAAIADLLTLFTFATILTVFANAIIITDNEIAVFNDVSQSSIFSAYITAAMPTTTRSMLATDLMDPFADPADFVMSANIAIIMLSDVTAPARRLGSISDNIASAPTITPMATVITIRLPTHFCAPLVATIINARIALKAPTAAIPLTKSSVFTMLSNTAIPAIIPIAVDIATSVDAILGASGPMPFTDFINAFISTPNKTITDTPLMSSPTDIRLMSATTPTNKAMAKDMETSKPPSLTISPLFVFFTIFFKIATNMRKPAAKSAPFPISPKLSLPISFTTPTNKAIAITILTNMPPNLSICFPDFLVTRLKRPTKIIKPVIKAAPLIISSTLRTFTSFITPMISSIVQAIFLIIFPALSIFLAAFPRTAKPYAINTAEIAAIIPASPRNPRIASSGFIEPISFTVAATNNSATPIPTNPALRPSIFIPLSLRLNDADAPSTLFIANAKPTRMPANAPNTRTEFHNVSVSI